MNENVFTLATHRDNSLPTIEKKHGYVGRGYDDNRLAEACHGVVANYALSVDKSCVMEEGEMAYLYDGEAMEGYANNRFDLSGSEQGEPLILTEGERNHLQMSLQFHLRYDSDAFAAKLAVVHLVRSQRQLLLDSGELVTLIDHQQPLLYLADPTQSQAYTVIGEQDILQSHTYTLPLTVAEPIPETIHQQPVTTLTLMEQYQSFFLQRETVDDSATIWTPLLAPVSWGWSIRVGRRADQAWGILRRKLIKPTVGHDGLVLPQWQGSFHQYYQPASEG